MNGIAAYFQIDLLWFAVLIAVGRALSRAWARLGRLWAVLASTAFAQHALMVLTDYAIGMLR